jgi:hypothetical protein
MYVQTVVMPLCGTAAVCHGLHAVATTQQHKGVACAAASFSLVGFVPSAVAAAAAVATARSFLVFYIHTAGNAP